MSETKIDLSQYHNSLSRKQSGNPTDLESSVAYSNLVFTTLDGDAGQ